MSNFQTPPFLLTYWNPFNENAPGLGQSFLNYVKDVSLANYTAKVTGNLVGSYIQSASDEQISTIKKGFRFLDQRMARVEQEHINTNILLKNIGELLKLPDSEKQRQLYIERGLKFSNQTSIDDDLAIDAKNELEAALKLMPQDWFVLQQLGILFLYNEKVLEVTEAKNYFLRAAKYANADLQTEGIIFINNLFKQQLSSPFENTNNTPSGLKDFVREAYLNAALSAYILSEFQEAVNIAKKALNLEPEDSKSLFLTAKYLARNNNIEEAFGYLTKAIEKSPYLAIATFGDKDLLAIPQALQFCNNSLANFFNRFELIRSRINIIAKSINNSRVSQLVGELESKNDIMKYWEILQEPLVGNNFYLVEKDTLFNEAATVVSQEKAEHVSIRTLQHNMKSIGYDPDRARQLLNQLENVGIITKTGSTTYYDLYYLVVGEYTVKHLLDDTLKGYLVKDLDLKWDEIQGKLLKKEKLL